MAILKRLGTEDALAAIDSALSADVVMCFCGCGRMVDGTAPSMYFYTQRCSEFWHRSQLHPNPDAWRTEQRHRQCELEAGLRHVAATEAERRDLTPREGDGPSALDRLEPRPSPFRDRVRPPFPGDVYHHPVPRRSDHNPYPPPPVPRPEPEPRTVTARVRRLVEHFMPPRRTEAYDQAVRDLAEAQCQLAFDIGAAVRDGGLLAQLQAVQAEDEVRRRELEAQTWSITYVDGGPLGGPSGWSTWRVDVGRLSEHVYVGPDQSHQAIVMGCVERLRARQNGRME